jgi:23S rRNA pseudouridine1911/1915/1917 synthase
VRARAIRPCPAPEPDAPLRILVEHPRLVVADKPAGIAVHPLAPGEGGTLANAVVARFPECAGASPDPREGGAVQRLDVGTSGCVVFARDREAWDEMHAALRARKVEKVYLALVHGRVASGGVLSVPLAQRGGRAIPAPDDVAAARLAAKGASVRPAETHYDVVRAFERFTLLRVRIVTGVMHQIRAHLAYLGHPVAGDAQYGGAAAAPPGLARPFLHAVRVALDAPGGGPVEAESPLPPELEAVLAGVGGQAPAKG